MRKMRLTELRKLIHKEMKKLNEAQFIPPTGHKQLQVNKVKSIVDKFVKEHSGHITLDEYDSYEGTVKTGDGRLITIDGDPNWTPNAGTQEEMRIRVFIDSDEEGSEEPNEMYYLKPDEMENIIKRAGKGVGGLRELVRMAKKAGSEDPYYQPKGDPY